jgi:hypothetical protein
MHNLPWFKQSIHQRRTKLILIALPSVVMLLSACTPAPSQVKPTPLAPAALATVTSEQGVSKLPTSPPSTPTSAPESGCPIPPGSPPIPNLESSFIWASELQDYLNQGGLVEPLANVLASQFSLSNASAGIVRQDLTGDGLEDLAVTLYAVDEGTEPAGSLLIFHCEKDHYQLAYSSSPGQNLGPPVLLSVQDLNADGVTELLYTRENCGAHTCFKQVEVLRWHRSRFENIFEGRSDDMPSPLIEIVGPVSDGSYQIEVTAQGIGSVGAGPFRQFTRIWSWSAQQSRFIVEGEQLAPPTFRIHMLHDADDAASAGNLEAALVMYQRVREDGRLDDWIKGEAGYSELAAFAAYRQVTVDVILGRFAAAEQAVQFLQEGNPDGSPGYGMRLLAEAYWQTYLETNDPQAACANAQRFAEQHPTEVLEPLQYGYANRTYTPADVCLPST